MIGALVGLLALTQTAAPATSAATAREGGPRFERLESGLRIGVLEEHGLPLVSVQLWYGVGSASDEAGAEGLCQITRLVLEQRDDAPQRMRAAGARRFDSRTLMDACYFASVLPPDCLEHVLQIELRRMRPLVATQEEVAAAIAAAMQENQLERGDAAKLAKRRLLAAMFGTHPYHHPPGFVNEGLKGLTAEQVNRFARRWFVPGNALLLVVGDVDPAAALGRMQELFGALEWRRPPQLRDAALPQAAATAPAETPGSKGSQATIAWLTPGARDTENAAIDVLMHRLCNPVDGPLARRLADMGCAAPRWRHEQWRQAGMLVLEVDGSPEAGSAVRDEIERAAKAVPSEIEFNRARALTTRDRLHAAADFGQQALRLGWWDMVGGDALLAGFERAAVARLSVGQMQQAAAGLLRARRICLGGPLAPENLSPSAEAAPGGPRPAPTPDIQAAKLEVIELRPGLRVRWRRIPGAELVEVRTVITAGLNDVRPLIALMAVGSTRHTVDQIRDYLTYHASEIYPSGPPHLGLIGRGPADRAVQLVELEAELIRFPQTSREACARAAELHQAHQSLLHAAARHAETELYVPRGFIGLTCSAAQYPADAEEVAAALAELSAVNDVEIIVTGDTSRAELLNAVRAAWPAPVGP